MGIFEPRHTGSSPLELWYVAGQLTSSILTAFITPAAETLFALPFVIEDTSRTVDKVALAASVGGGSSVRIGIYQNIGDTNLYPAALLADSGTISVGLGVTQKAFVQALASNNLFWFVLLTGLTSPSSLFHQLSNDFWDILGVNPDLNFTGTGIPGYGWTAPYAGGLLPNPFPLAAALIDASFIPTIVIHLSS